jgi:EAL domain-containing protein (putative c-di-GMP-specific phosphodiesterase class I)
VARLPDAPDGRALVKAIVAMARPLGLKVLADGVETQVQKDFLKDIGVDEIEGRITGVPMPAGDATQHLLAALDRCGVDFSHSDTFPMARSMAHLLSH